MTLRPEQNKRREKAKQLRYKKPVCTHMNLQYIIDELEEMYETVYDVQYFVREEENLIAALDGDEDEAYEFRMAFSDLAAELERFREDLEEQWIPECFDDLFPAAGADYFNGYMGYDSYEGDYFGLQPYEYEWAEKEAEKRICRMTKKELLEATGACLKVVVSYLAVRYRYDCLESSMAIIREKNMTTLKAAKRIEELYEAAEKTSNHFQYTYCAEIRELDKAVEQMPPESWL